MILYVDDELIVLEKPSGLLSVPGRGADKQDCLAARVQAEYPEALTVHRLDMETSGAIVMARTREVHRNLSIMFAEREITKEYQAVVAGVPEQDVGSIDLPLTADWPNRPRQKVDYDTGKPALTRFEVLEKDQEKNCTLLRLIPVTGRTHQLRLHLASIGHPVLGDRLYASDEVIARASRLLLHSCLLAFRHPRTGVAVRVDSRPPFQNSVSV